MQTYYDYLMPTVGEPFAFPNPAGADESAQLAFHPQGINLLLYSNNAALDLEKLQEPMGVYWAVHSGIPYLVVLIGEEEAGAAFLWSMNSYSIPEERFEAWLASNENRVGLWLIDNSTNVLIGGRILMPHMGGAMLTMLKPHLKLQRESFMDAEAVNLSVESLLERHTTETLINGITEFAIENGTYYTDRIAPKRPESSGLIKLDASNNYGADILAEYEARQQSLRTNVANNVNQHLLTPHNAQQKHRLN